MLCFSFIHGEGRSIEPYVVPLVKSEREELSGITIRDSNRSQKMINGLVLLNRDEDEFNERRATGEAIAGNLRISLRKVNGSRSIGRRSWGDNEIFEHRN